MAHGLTDHDSMFSVRQVPWHGLGAVLDRAPESVSEALTLAGLDWHVRKEPVFRADPIAHLDPDGPGAGFTPVDGHYFTVRGDTGAVLGIVGERYRVAQNVEALQFLDSLIGSALHFETAGSLHGGRRVWALAKLPEHIEVGGDATRPYVLIMNSHDASTAVVAATTPIRVVCQNTLTWGLQRAQRSISIRHTEALQSRMHEARRVLNLSIDYYKQFKKFGDQLASEQCTERQLRAALDELYPSGVGDGTPRTQRSREQTKEAITELFLRGRTVGNAPGSKWAAANAICEYLDWYRPLRGQGAGKADQRFARTVDDGGAKQRAAQLVAAA
jgi:phage/plasmid-like protein (TIGR03299 family)